MTETEKVEFYNLNKLMIHQKIKTAPETKPLWRRLFWTTGKDSNIYKSGCVDIYIAHFPKSYKRLTNKIQK